MSHTNTATQTTAKAPARVRLTQLTRGQTGRLDAAEFADDSAAHLTAMGLRPSCQLRVCKAGQPCIVHVDGHAGGCRIALSRDLADSLYVLPH
ncbi:MAG: FeoA family protein [Phycisphaerales bacterium]